MIRLKLDLITLLASGPPVSLKLVLPLPIFQGLPHSEHLEKEILILRNELLKFELEKERLFLELQEEKKAQVDRERRIKEQEQKIGNLSTLFMSSNVDDRDSEKEPKKVNRRETWCPRQPSSDLAVHDFIWKSPGKHLEEEAIDSILYPMRRDRRFDLPPAFDNLVDDEAWNDSTGIEEPLPPSDFENIADEEMDELEQGAHDFQCHICVQYV